MKICLQCNEPYTSDGKKFCSNSCKMRYRNLRDNPAKNPDVREKLSESAKRRGTEHMMTKESRQKAIPKIAEKRRGKKLSQEWKNAIGRGVKRAGCKPPDNSKHLVGPNHPNWRGGNTTIRQKDLGSPIYKEFRNTVLKRDNYTCQKCGKRGGKLHAHHIKSWAEYPDLRYEVSNGVTLCVHCHHLEHTGVPSPSAEQPHTLADLYSDRDAI